MISIAEFRQHVVSEIPNHSQQEHYGGHDPEGAVEVRVRPDLLDECVVERGHEGCLDPICDLLLRDLEKLLVIFLFAESSAASLLFFFGSFDASWLFWLRVVESGDAVGVLFDGLFSEEGVGRTLLVHGWGLVVVYLIDEVHHFDFLKDLIIRKNW